jgi:uncharacterized protein (TIGR00369 family)
MPAITHDDLNEIVRDSLPWVADMGLAVEEIGDGTCRVRLPFDAGHLRPGGIIAGPMMVALASYASYVAVLSAVGRVEMTVAINLNCNFLKRAQPADLLAEARVVSRSKRLAYAETKLFSAGAEAAGPVAHITATYSIPA